MTKQEKELLSILKILADESKFKIILHLMKGEECVCNLAENVDIERTLVSHHLKTLKDSGLITDRKNGIWIHYSLNKQVFKKLEKLFNSVISSENISDECCKIHTGVQLHEKGSL